MSERDRGGDGVDLTRRSLLQTAGAAAVATSLGGCLSGDESPAAGPNVDEETAYGTCWMCHHACGQKLTVRDGTAVDITGVDGHPRGSAGPGTEGTLCPKGQAELEKLYDPDRITQPYIREDGELREADWDEAFEYTARRLEEFADEHGSEKMLDAASWSTTNVHSYFWGNLYGTPERIGRGRHVCHGGSHVSGDLMGIGTSDIRFVDYQHSDYIIMWGRNVFEAFAGQWEAKQLLDAIDDGATLVTIDPQHTQTAEKADYWLPIEPRTDGALALAMGHVILEEELHDEEFIEEQTYGFDSYREAVEDKTPEWAAEITGIDADLIREIAIGFAEAAPAAGIAMWTGVGQYSEAQKASQNIFALHGLVGNIDRPGGLRMWQPPAMSLNPFAERGIDLPNNAADKTPALRKYDEYAGIPARHLSGIVHDLVPEMVDNGHIMGMFNHYDNPLNDGSTQAWLEAVETMDLVITIDAYWNDLTRNADVVFPEAIQLEKDTLINYAPLWSAYNDRTWVTASKAVHEPMGECKSGYQIYKGIAEEMGWGEYFPWENEAEYSDDMLANIDYSFEEVAAENYVLLDEYGYEQWEDRGFPTATGRFQFDLDQEHEYLQAAMEAGIETGPQWQPPGTWGHETDEEYPLHLYDTRSVFFTFSADQVLDHLTEQYARKHGLEAEDYRGNYLAINPADAEPRDIETGDMVTVETPTGSGELMAYVSERTRPGFATAEFGFGTGTGHEEGTNTMMLHDGQFDPISSQVDRHMPGEVRKNGGD
ncbi:molybdopterin-containing oxidoreductase family protein [Halobiforma nitratireducens]|uniref:Molybdopterin oxidoreductase n=1 Tax=Halobiforma nitratireducens JCM 10879 TaxID=1227454 RepID=M0M8T3_9EURY|nr:molybdopterin-dependent oxidoreductase [Halobiforma nitratireducens]EMA41004.1 molybdopterin oxidoreductase [Halobiforma nitratireducens JCM 10879]